MGSQWETENTNVIRSKKREIAVSSIYRYSLAIDYLQIPFLNLRLFPYVFTLLLLLLLKNAEFSAPNGFPFSVC